MSNSSVPDSPTITESQVDVVERTIASWLQEPLDGYHRGLARECCEAMERQQFVEMLRALPDDVQAPVLRVLDPMPAVHLGPSLTSVLGGMSTAERADAVAEARVRG